MSSTSKAAVAEAITAGEAAAEDKDDDDDGVEKKSLPGVESAVVSEFHSSARRLA